MGVVRDVNIKIKGQVPADCRDNYYDVLVAKLKLICAEYDLDLEEVFSEDEN